VEHYEPNVLSVGHWNLRWRQRLPSGALNCLKSFYWELTGSAEAGEAT
jgi:hypothetical protein